MFKFYPEVFSKVNVSKVEIPFMKASEDMDPKDWQKIAKTVVELLNDSNIQGIVITHGTDTMHYTSAALSFFIKNLNKPVVLTYSQRSSDRASSDADLNLQCASLVAISDMYVASVSSTIRWAILAGIPVINYDVYQYGYEDFILNKEI